jgi:hypothetical protein
MYNTYILLMHDRFFKDQDKPIYRLSKINMVKITYDQIKIFNITYYAICNDSEYIKENIMEIFKEKYIHRKDIGEFYFFGDSQDMIHDIRNEISKSIQDNTLN